MIYGKLYTVLTRFLLFVFFLGGGCLFLFYIFVFQKRCYVPDISKIIVQPVIFMVVLKSFPCSSFPPYFPFLSRFTEK